MSLHIQQYPSRASEIAEKKAVLLLIHGGALSHRMFKDMLPYLSGYDIVAPDLPGHGASASAGPFTFSTSTEMLQQSVKQLQTSDERYRHRRWVAVGISLGGQATLDLICRHPDLVDAAIVSGVSIHPPSDDAPWELPHMPTSEEWIALMIDDVGKLGGPEVAKQLQDESFAFEFPKLGSSALPPTLVMVGQDDTAMAKRDFRELAGKVKEASPQSTSSILDNSWHNHPIDVPERFAEVIQKWASDPPSLN